MAYVVRSKGRRYEIRESVATPAGPRARTLATFAVLDDDALQAARAKAKGTVDEAALRRSSRRLGAPVADAPADAAARRLVAELAEGRRPTPALEALLRDALGTGGLSPAGPSPQVTGDMASWIGAGDERRGRALVELLELADRIPTTRTGVLAAPRLAPRNR